MSVGDPVGNNLYFMRYKIIDHFCVFFFRLYYSYCIMEKKGKIDSELRLYFLSNFIVDARCKQTGFHFVKLISS